MMLRNPFLISGYKGPDYFCDREKETIKVVDALSNDRNISLISPRRMGKTGLIQHVFYKLEEEDKNIFCFYIDIFSTQNLYEFVLLLSKTIIGKLDTKSESVFKQISNFLKSMRPSLSYDSVTGIPNISINLEPSQTDLGLQEIFNYLKDSNKRVYIAIDEFQQVIEYPEKGTEALLRSYMQFLPNVKFIFAGSKKHLMDAMFSSVNRPFYQSTQKISLKEIPLKPYSEFSKNLFKLYGKVLNEDVFIYIYEKLMGHTWYIQYILNVIFSRCSNECSIKDVEMILADILEEENVTYKTYCELIPKGQLRLLRAIAREKKIYEPYESAFMKKYDLTAVSSVRQALEALKEKSFILKDEDGSYFVYDRFFSIWLEK